MADYIRREDAIAALENLAKPYYKSGLVYDMTICAGINTALREVQGVPAADVAPVVRGRWIKLDMHSGMEQYKCSACNQECYVPTCMGEPLYSYCPNCGAKMEVGEDG